MSSASSLLVVSLVKVEQSEPVTTTADYTTQLGRSLSASEIPFDSDEASLVAALEAHKQVIVCS